MCNLFRGRSIGLVASVLPLLAATGHALPGEVRIEQKISSTDGGFAGGLNNGDGFGGSLAVLGDLDGDNVPDVAVGARGDDEGAIWILFMNADGTVKAETKIASGVGGFTGQLDAGDAFGHGLANLGDVDGDGVTDLAAGAFGDDDGGFSRGAVWVLFLNANGTVKAEQKISTTTGGFFDPTVAPGEEFGFAVAGPGDVDGDGVRDLAVGAPKHASGGLSQRGAVWILFLNANGTVRAQSKIGASTGAFGGALSAGDRFGGALAAFGDIDNNGVTDLIVGADGDDDGGMDTGAVWIIELRPAGTVKDENKISETSGSFEGFLPTGGNFGRAVGIVGDDDGNGRPDVLVGGRGAADRGEVWLLHLNGNGNVILETRFADGAGGFMGQINNGDLFGSAVGSLGDLDGFGEFEFIAGAAGDDDGGADHGAAWVLFRGDLPDCDGDGIPDDREPDCDGDGVPDDCEADCDNDGLPDDCEFDCDGDGTPDDCEPDCDGDGIPDDCEPDCDGDGVPDGCEAFDCDGDGIPDKCEPDCDDNGVPDDCEIDCDGDGIPDNCEPDCDDDGTPDDCEPDCDADGVPDGCEADCDFDGIPDDCEPDCDGDGIPDDCDPICTGDPPDGVEYRNGSGVNVECFTTSSEPILGTNWVAVVDTTTAPQAFFSFILFYDTPTALMTPFGELLVFGNQLAFDQAPLVDGIGVHVIALPAIPQLDGFNVFSQGLFSSGGGPILCNALDLTLHL